MNCNSNMRRTDGGVRRVLRVACVTLYCTVGSNALLVLRCVVINQEPERHSHRQRVESLTGALMTFEARDRESSHRTRCRLMLMLAHAALRRMRHVH